MKAIKLLLLPLLLLLLLAGMQPATAQTDERCFDATGYCISGRIRVFWENNGGLPVFGYPITPQREEEIEGQSYQVQWFERERLELHPENAPPYDVLLGRLGADSLEQQGRRWQDFPTSQPQPDCRFFPETGQNVCGDILAAWRANGLEFDGQPGTSAAESLALFGLPLSPPRTETVEGRAYTVQWFERARFELHPENAPPFNVLLGLLGRSVLTGTSGAAPPDNGRILFAQPATDGNQALALINADGTELTQLTDGNAFDTQPAWSSDGNRIVFVSDRDAPRSERTSQQDIYRLNADGTDLQRLTDASGRDTCPNWSPDGSRIVFLSERDQTGRFSPYIMDADGENETRLLDRSTGCPRWSPDGTRIAYASERAGRDGIFTLRPDGSAETLVGEDGSDAMWSPDGTQIAYDRYDGILLVNADGTNERFLTVGVHPRWSPDGERIAYTSYLSGEGQAHSITPSGTRNVRLSSPGASKYRLRWSPDGSQLVLLSRTAETPGTGIVVLSADGTREQEIARGNHPIWQP